MALSDKLTKLANRAKVAEDDAAAANAKARAAVEQRMNDIKTSADNNAARLQAKVNSVQANGTATWGDYQSSWDAHVEKVRGDIARRKAQHSASTAESRAEWAEDDADLSIDYAYAAVEAAEYAVLDAILARREANEAAVAVPA